MPPVYLQYGSLALAVVLLAFARRVQETNPPLYSFFRGGCTAALLAALLLLALDR